MTDSMLPILRQLHDADGDRERAAVLLCMPDSVVLKYHEPIEAVCRRAGFQAGCDYLSLRVSLCLAVRDDAGRPPIGPAAHAEAFRVALAEFAAGDA